MKTALKSGKSKKGKVKIFKEKQALVEKALEEFFPPAKDYPDLIYRAMRHSLLSGGKRFRPLLTLTVAETFGKDPQEVLATACATEYIHTYSLIHDDLPAIDNDTLRRGQPTCHVLFGEDVAILAGDALFAEAFYLISSKQMVDDPKLLVKVITELSAASGVRGMVKGQVADIFWSGKEIDQKTLDFIHTHKTGRLISAAARCGAFLGGVSARELEIITDYASPLGLAFQIVDDILDIVGEEEKLGKKVGQDEQERKATFPKFFGIEKAKKLAQEQINKAKIALRNLNPAKGGVNRETSNLKELADFVWERET